MRFAIISFLISVSLLISACQNQTGQIPGAWLAGEWVLQIEENTGHAIIESWKLSDQYLLSGESIQMQKGVSNVLERMRIEEKEGAYFWKW